LTTGSGGAGAILRAMDGRDDDFTPAQVGTSSRATCSICSSPGGARTPSRWSAAAHGAERRAQGSNIRRNARETDASGLSACKHSHTGLVRLVAHEPAPRVGSGAHRRI